MIVYCGWWRTTEVKVSVDISSQIAGKINCLECGGTGIWNFAEPEIKAFPCVNCKGTGKIYISI